MIIKSYQTKNCVEISLFSLKFDESKDCKKNINTKIYYMVVTYSIQLILTIIRNRLEDYGIVISQFNLIFTIIQCPSFGYYTMR